MIEDSLLPKLVTHVIHAGEIWEVVVACGHRMAFVSPVCVGDFHYCAICADNAREQIELRRNRKEDPRIDPHCGDEFMLRSGIVCHSVRVAARSANVVVFHLRVAGRLLIELHHVPLSVWKKQMRVSLLVVCGKEERE